MCALLLLLVEPWEAGWEAGITRNNNNNSAENLYFKTQPYD